MCTVTYLPFDNSSFLLTSSRDEKPSRKASLSPEWYPVNENRLLFPKDQQAQGTWIATTREGRTLCLLNGGLEKHIPSPPYIRSRGLVLLDAFSYESLGEFTTAYSFQNIEPFTLIEVQRGVLNELRWTGSKRVFREHDVSVPHIWSSVTLYSDDIIAKREKWFYEWCTMTPEKNVESIRRFHRFAGDGDQSNNVFMNRNNLMRTVSITTVDYSVNGVAMIYEDVLEADASKLEGTSGTLAPA